MTALNNLEQQKQDQERKRTTTIRAKTRVTRNEGDDPMEICFYYQVMNDPKYNDGMHKVCIPCERPQ